MKTTSKTQRKLKRTSPQPMRLEQRLMFDGAGVLEGVKDFLQIDKSIENLDTSDHSADFDIKVTSTPPAFEPSAPESSSSPSVSTTVRAKEIEIVFINDSVPNWQDLANNARPDVEVIVLDGNSNGIEQVSTALEDRQDITAVHIVSHGSEGMFRLGDTPLNNDSINTFQAELAEWGSHLAPNGDILIYGCDVAKGSAGETFISDFSRITAADIAASTDATGSAALGGDWTLESRTGPIETQSVFDSTVESRYSALLAVPTVTQIVRQTPSYDTTNADAVTFRVTFDEAVTNVDGTDFAFAPSSVSGATVQLVTPVANSNGTQYDVQVGLPGASGSHGR